MYYVKVFGGHYKKLRVFEKNFGYDKRDRRQRRRKASWYSTELWVQKVQEELKWIPKILMEAKRGIVIEFKEMLKERSEITRKWN